MTVSKLQLVLYFASMPYGRCQSKEPLHHNALKLLQIRKPFPRDRRRLELIC